MVLSSCSAPSTTPPLPSPMALSSRFNTGPVSVFDNATNQPSIFWDIVQPEVFNGYIDELFEIPRATDAGFTGPGAAAFNRPIKVEMHRDKMQRTANDARYGLAYSSVPCQQFYGNQQVVPALLPQQPPTFVRGADENRDGGTVQRTAAAVRRRRIKQKTDELSRLIPGVKKMSTAEMLQTAERQVKLLQAQVSMLALMQQSEKENTATVPATEQARMDALLSRGRVQGQMAAAGMCLVPRTLVDAMARDKDVTSNPLVRRGLARYMASMEQ